MKRSSIITANHKKYTNFVLSQFKRSLQIQSNFIMASTSTATEAPMAEEKYLGTQSMTDDEKENLKHLRGGETFDIFGKYLWH